MTTERLGDVANNNSNYLAVLFVDAPHASAWRGPSNSGKDDDYERANKSLEVGKFVIDVGKGKGVVAEIGGCGRSDVHRVDGATLVMVEHYTGDDSAEIEADFIDALTSIPTKRPKRLGEVEVKSGVLAIVSLTEKVSKLSDKVIAETAKGAEARAFEWGMLVPIPKGVYEIWGEDFGDVEGEWGTISNRIRVVAKGTPVVAGKPIGEAAPKAKEKKSKATGKKNAPKAGKMAYRRFLAPASWKAIESFAVTNDGTRVVAGELGGFGVCAWDAEGKILWERQLPEPISLSSGVQTWPIYSRTVCVSVASRARRIAASIAYASVSSLDLDTGKSLAEEWRGKVNRVAITPDEKLLVMREQQGTTLFEFPSMKRVAEFTEYCNFSNIAIASDRVAVNGSGVHLYDLKKRSHVTTFPSDSAWSLASSRDGSTLAAGLEKGVVVLFDVKSLKQTKAFDATPDRSRKPTITSLAFDPAGVLVAVAAEDGAIRIWDTKKLALVRTIDKLDATIPDTGSTQLNRVEFRSDGKELWVSSPPKKEPAGLTVFSI